MAYCTRRKSEKFAGVGTQFLRVSGVGVRVISLFPVHFHLPLQLLTASILLSSSRRRRHTPGVFLAPHLSRPERSLTSRVVLVWFRMSSRIAKARSKKKLFSGLSFKKSFKAKDEATPVSWCAIARTAVYGPCYVGLLTILWVVLAIPSVDLTLSVCGAVLVFFRGMRPSWAGLPRIRFTCQFSRRGGI